jgi:predicted kinase
MSHPARRSPVLIAMAGLPGTGKSTCADLIARNLHVPLVDKDDLLELVRHSSIEDELEQGRLAYDLVFSLASRQLANDTSVIVDTCLAFGWLRSKLAGIATAHNARMLVVHCVCSDDVARKRIAARATRGLPHRNLTEYDRLRLIFEDFDTSPNLTVNTTDDLTALPERLSAVIEQRNYPHPKQASDR